MKKVLITGCNKGIGLAIARKFLDQGFEVLGTYRNSNPELDVLVEKSDGKFRIFRVDFSAASDLDSFIHSNVLKERPDILINNVGMAQRKSFLELNDVEWTNMFNVNFFSAVKLSQAVLPAMIEKKEGRILNIASVGGQWGGLHQIHYAASKAALINLTKSLAKSFSQANLTVNCISPGSIETEMIQAELPQDATKMKALLDSIPSKRLGQPEEIAHLALFLASKEAAYITGQTININGGIYFG